jgi:integrase
VETENPQRYGPSVNAIRIILFTGARPGEVFNMRWEQLDLAEGVWSKPASATKQKRRHHIPLVQDAVTLLKHIHSQGTKGDYVFPSRTTPIRPLSEARKTWAKVMKAAEIENEIGTRLYDLRHTFATHLVASGQSLFSVGKLLGHSTTKVTERYAHADLDGLRAALGSMDQVLSEASNVTPLRKG